MAEILGKDLDNLDISEAARMPYDMTEGKNEPSGPQFITGTDLERSARISQDWKKPVATIAQVTGQGKITGESDYGVVTQVINSLGNATFDTIANVPDNTKNILAQGTLQGTSITPELIEKSRQEILHGKMTDFLPKEKAQAREEMVDVLDGRDYPVAKYAQRVIANATANTSNRALVRELYANARGIDLGKWYNEGAQIVGNMVPLMGLGGVAGATGKSLGLSRAATTRLATNIMKGATAIQMGGDYAYETAADYLARTGDTNFENFTAKDAKGFSALAYGAIGAEIEFMGGVEPIVAGSLSKVGLKSGLGRAGLKIAAGEASEEFLQGLTEQLTRVMDGSVNKTWGEALKESLQGAAWGAFIGGTIGTTAFYTNRANLTKNLRKMFPQMKEKEATKLAEKMIETTADVSSQDQTLRDSLRKKVEFMYDGVDIENRENTIDAITDLEYAIINMDSAERGIELADNPIFKGEVNELGWFRDGIPENRRAEIQGYVNEIRDLKARLKELNSAETKDFVKIDTVEEKLRLAQETALDKVSDLVRKDKDEIRQMLAEQKNNFALRRAIQNIQERARRAMSATEKAEKATQESAQKAQLKAKTRQEQEVRGAIRGLRDKIDGTSSSQETPETAIAQDMGYQLLKDNGYSDAQIVKMKPRELTQVVQTLARRQLGAEIMFQEQLDLADENARLDDIYPEYKGETINIDGKERTVYNSNGDRIAKSEPALRNFYKWFGDSKVVDEQGRPLVVYHGSKSVFDTFDINKAHNGNYGKGFYFTSQEYNALYYASSPKKVLPVYLKANNPIVEYEYVSLEQIDKLKIPESIKNEIHKKYHSMHPWSFGTLEHFITNMSLQNKYGKDWDKRQDNAKLYLDFTAQTIKIFESSGYDGVIAYKDFDEVVVFEPNQIKSVDNRGTFSEDTGNIYHQGSGKGNGDKKRGAYVPEYRFIYKANSMDETTLSHELAHDWFEVFYERYRSGTASKEFMTSWGALEKALGITDESTKAERAKASESFARAYEGWVLNKKDWEKNLNVDDTNRDKIIKEFEKYQGNLRDVYESVMNPYFKNTWGNVGELKPELVNWFERMTNITSLDTLVKRGEMTETEARGEVFNRALDKAIEDSNDPETKRVYENVKTLNDTSRYEVEGGNKNAIQARLSELARAIDENNMAVKKDYNTHRDMMKVAQDADTFVKTRTDEALKIINAEIPEVEGLFKEDLYTALERLAIEESNLDLLDELRSSAVANGLAKELGQRVAGFRNFMSDGQFDVMSPLKSLDRRFEKATENRKAKKSIEQATDLYAESVREQDATASKNLESFLNELECK